MREIRMVLVVSLYWLAVCGATLHAAGVCASSPTAALRAMRAGDSVFAGSEAQGHGYRVQAVRWDPLLQQSWAVIRSCDHLERPALTMRTELPITKPAVLSSMAGRFAGVSIVRVGDVVRLWKNESYAHIELIGTAEENGGIGTRVRVRLAASKDNDRLYGQPTQYLAGVVRGPADVELEP
jgi:hypothetical protein